MCRFEVTVTSVSLPLFVSHRGLFNTNQRLSLARWRPTLLSLATLSQPRDLNEWLLQRPQTIPGLGSMSPVDVDLSICALCLCFVSFFCCPKLVYSIIPSCSLIKSHTAANAASQPQCASQPSALAQPLSPLDSSGRTAHIHAINIIIHAVNTLSLDACTHNSQPLAQRRNLHGDPH